MLISPLFPQEGSRAKSELKVMRTKLRKVTTERDIARVALQDARAELVGLQAELHGLRNRRVETATLSQ